ncbi:MAG: hypothetical protein ACFFCB_07155 [Candidatus Odinarchaeota archaeon]
MNELKVSNAPSVFTRFRERFSSWDPWRRAFFIMGIYALLSCILMMLFWVFPPPILIRSPAWEPYLELANNWTIAIPMGMVVVSVFVTNMSFRMPEDPRFILRFVTLLVCVEIAVLATWNALEAYINWYRIFAPVIGHEIPIEPFPDLWFLSTILRFIGAHTYQGFLLLIGLGVIVLVLLLENIY